MDATLITIHCSDCGEPITVESSYLKDNHIKEAEFICLDCQIEF